MSCELFLLTMVALCVDAQSLTVTPCIVDAVNGTSVRVAEVRRGQTSQFHCRGLAANGRAYWMYLPGGGGAEHSAGYCYPLTNPDRCRAETGFPGFTSSRPSDSEVVMTVHSGVPGVEDRVKTGSLGCKHGKFLQKTNATNYCRMDLIDQAEGACSVKFERQNADDWVATGSCNITSAYSSRGRYMCHWHRTKDSSPEKFQSTTPYTGPSGVCDFVQPLPSAGRYSYRVRITPGEVSKDASFGSNSNQIITPTAPTVSGCSSDSYIEENTPVNCTCSTTSLGQPAGRLVWRRVGVASPVASSDYGNDRLVVSQILVRGDHDVTQFRCDVDWTVDVFGSPLTFKVESMCPYTVINDPISQQTYEAPATALGKAYISHHMCLSNGEPYVTLQCQRDELHGASWSSFQPIQGCIFMDVVTSNITVALRNISLLEISVETITDVINRTTGVLSNCEDCDELDIVYVADIIQRTARLDNISQESGQTILELIDTITEVESSILRDANTIGNATNRIIAAIEDIGDKIVFDNDTNEVILVSKKTAVGVWDLSEVTDNLTVGMELVQGGHSLPTLAREDLEPLSEDVSPTYNRTDSAIFLQGRCIRNITDNYPGKDVRLTIVVFPDTALFRHGRLETSGDLNRNSTTVLNSKVISAKITVDGVKVTALGDDVVTTVYSPINVPDESRSEKSICVFWDPAGSKGAGAWSRDGCKYTSTLQDRDVCVCNHLTNFAILLDLYGQDALPDAVHQTALSVITIIGLSLSIAGLSVTVFCFLLIKKLRQGRTQQTQFHRAVSMLGSWVVFLAGFRQAESGASCIAVAAMLHYLILVSFMWMLMEGLLQYLLLVKVFGVGFENYILKTAVVAWSLPLIPVVTILAIDTDLYHGGAQYCWMSLTPFYYAFLAPVAIIMLINIVFYVLVIYNICRRRNIGSKGTTNRMLGIRASVICFIALGLSWTFAFFAIGDARLVFQYLFTLTSTLQGFLVFLAFTARDPSVRAYWTRLRCRWGQNPTDTELTTRTKGSREPGIGGKRCGSSETVFGGGRSNAHLLGESQGSVGLSHNSP